MKVFFTEIFALYKKNKKFFLINKKLDTIIPIEETLYFMLNQILHSSIRFAPPFFASIADSTESTQHSKI